MGFRFMMTLDGASLSLCPNGDVAAQPGLARAQSSFGPLVFPWHEQKCAGGPLGWHLLHAKLLYECWPPGTRGWLNVALDQDRLGEWQFWHVLP